MAAIRTGESTIHTPYAVRCTGSAKPPDCLPCTNDLVFLTWMEYDRQMEDSDVQWKCPRCGSYAEFDDKNYADWMETADESDKGVGMRLPDIEQVAALVHESWMDGKKAKRIFSRKAEDGEEMMVPYADLSEAQKEQDRALVRTVYAAIEKAMEEGSAA